MITSLKGYNLVSNVLISVINFFVENNLFLELKNVAEKTTLQFYPFSGLSGGLMFYMSL